MSAINITDLDNAKRDTDHIAAIATSPAPTATDRLGRTKRTIAGTQLEMDAALRSVGRLPPVVYAAGLSMTSVRQTVAYSGVTYAPRADMLPFTTSGTFEAAKFEVVQGVSGVDLAAPAGLPAYGFLAGEMQSILDNMLPMQSYAALRNYSGRALGVRVTYGGIAGIFQRDVLDDTSVDNGGTVIVDFLGRRWKRLHDGTVSTDVFEFVADWNGTTGTNNAPKLSAMLQDGNIKKIVGRSGAYYFGAIAGDTSLINLNRDVVIDWGGADIKVKGDNSGPFTATAFIQFTDCKVDMSNYTFEDLHLDLDAGPSRGAVPVLIKASVQSTAGHRIGPCHIVKGQSFFTCVGAAPYTARSSDITLRGICSADDIYYGVNNANNGDEVRGQFTAARCNRAVFVYGCQDVDIKCRVKKGMPASANLLVSNSGNGLPATRRITVDATFDEMGGPYTLADQPSANGTGVYEDIDVTVRVGALGSNLPLTAPVFRVGAYAPSGELFTEEKSVTMQRVKTTLLYRNGIGNFDAAIKVYTPSANYGQFTINRESQYERSSLSPRNAAGVFLGPTFFIDGKVFRSVFGDLTNANAVAFIANRYLASQRTNVDVAGRLRVTARSGVGVGASYTICEFDILGDLSGSGAFRFVNALLKTTSSDGVAATITVVGSEQGLNISADSYTGPYSQLTATYQSF